MQGKVCLITGANRGIGRETALGLARLGATVLVVCRTQESAEATRSEISAATGNKHIRAYAADFSSQTEVKALVETIKSQETRLDVLINNAATYNVFRTTTTDGLEATFAVNHLAPFILTNGLLDLIRGSAPARIIMVASEAHQRVRDPEDWESRNSYSGDHAYNRSKLANIIYGYDLAGRLEGTGVSVNSVHPGNVVTPLLQAKFSRWWNSWVWPLIQGFLISPAEGALGPLYLASSPEVEGVTGRYYKQRQVANSSLISHDAVIGARLWNVSLRLSGELPPTAITGEHIAR